ncbi:MAG TPA: hypothetical protein VKQ32_20155 [Polyangia bacterium]|nr:hypothetical protein [Polyangia bacterium]
MLVALVAVVSFAVLVVLPPVFLALALRAFRQDCRTPRMRLIAPAPHLTSRRLRRAA